jgi:hypothetical protein
MYSLSTLLATLTLLSTALSAPLVIPLGSTGLTITISSDGNDAHMNNGQKVDMSPLMAMMANHKPPPPPQCPSPAPPIPAPGQEHPKAVYFITNAVNNSIVALNVGADGKLSDGSITPTRGAGGVGVDSTGKPAIPDGLFSQSVLRISDNVPISLSSYTYVTDRIQTMISLNPGSNTASLLSISPIDPTVLTMIGKPVDTMGDFPVSVTISKSLSMACIANTGARAGIACYKISPTGLTPEGGLRPFSLNQTTPPSGPLNTVSQTFFNSDSTALLTTVKGDPTKNNTGFLSSFPVVNGCVSMTGTKSSPNGTAVLFGSTVLPGRNDIFVTDASFGAATLSSSTSDFSVANVKAQTKIAGQKATCWTTFSARTGTAFVTDVARNTLNEIDTVTGAIVATVNGTYGNLGMIDLASKGGFVYVLAPGNSTVVGEGKGVSVVVFDVQGGRGSIKEVQNFEVREVDGRVQGMAVL